MTPQELKMVCRESNRVKSEKKIVLCSTTEKKMFTFEEIVSSSWKSKKFDNEEKQSLPPPHVSNCPLLAYLLFFKQVRKRVVKACLLVSVLWDSPL